MLKFLTNAVNYFYKDRGYLTKAVTISVTSFLYLFGISCSMELANTKSTILNALGLVSFALLTIIYIQIVFKVFLSNISDKF